MNAPVHVVECDIGDLVECVFLEVVFLEVRVHVQTRRSKMVGPRHVWYDALPVWSREEKSFQATYTSCVCKVHQVIVPRI